jgi:formamidopyrimidine-DNA glycosylase
MVSLPLSVRATLLTSSVAHAAQIGYTLQRSLFVGRFALEPSGLSLVVNPKLTGRLQLCPPDEKRAGPLHLTLHLDDPPAELRYVDSKVMGQVYLTDSVRRVPTFDEMGPDALSLSLEDFRLRLQPFRGEIKGILVRAAFVAGIGNAYADEILWAAHLHPFRKRTSLTPEEVERLYRAVGSTLRESIEQVRREMGEAIHLKPRDFFAVHMRAGQPCPRCGSPVSAITAHQRITNFCRTCQPGGLIRGMPSTRADA